MSFHTLRTCREPLCVLLRSCSSSHRHGGEQLLRQAKAPQTHHFCRAFLTDRMTTGVYADVIMLNRGQPTLICQPCRTAT